MADLERLLGEYEGKLSHIDLCAALMALTTCPAGPQRQQLAQQLTRTLAAARQGRPLIDCLDARGQASVLWAWAKMGYWPDPHFMQLLSTFTATARGTSGATPRDLSLVAWALNQAWQAWQDRPQPWHPSKQVVQEYMQKLQSACVPVLQEFNFQDVSNLLLAAQGTGALDEGLAPGLLLHIQRLLSATTTKFKFKPQNLSNSLSSLAKLRYAGGQELLQDAARAVMQRGCMRGSTPQAWSNLLWAFATLGQLPDSLELCRYVAEQVVHRDCMRGAKPQDWSNLLWAFATLRHPDSLELCQYVSGLVVQHDCMHGDTPQGWCNLVWAYATLRHYEDGGAVFDLAIATCPALLRDMNTQNMSNLLYACATVNHTRNMAQLLDSMLPHIRTTRGQFNEQGLANSCWSLAVLELSSHPAMADLMREANSRRQQQQHARFKLDEMLQLWQAHLELHDQGLVHLGLTGQLLVEAQRAWRGRGAKADGQPHNKFQQQVAAVVVELEPGSVVEMEGVTPCGMFGAVDMLVTRPGQALPLALEVDGHNHFLKQPPTRYDGCTELRNRQLERLPLRGLSGLVLVSHHEWYDKSHPAHLELLRVKLAQAVRGPGGSCLPRLVCRG